MEKRESFEHHRWVYVKILLFSAAGKKDVFEKNIYRMSIVLCSFDLVRISRLWCFYALACD